MARHDGAAAPDFQPLLREEGQPTAAQIEQVLRDAILSLALPPGTRVSEAETGARLGASRTPVREALGALRDEGLIVTVASRGNFVTALSESAIRGALFIRETLEMAALGQVLARGLEPEDDARLAAAVTSQKNAIAFGDVAAFHAADDQYHAALAGASGLPRLRTLVLREKTMLDRLRALRPADMDHLRVLEDEHRRLLNCIRKGRDDRAQKILSEHLGRTLDDLETLKAAHPAYFE